MQMIPRVGSKVRTRITVVEGGRHRLRDDHLATEEPLEIRLQAGGETQTVAVTMRTPGSDFELAAGFLHNEGIISEPAVVSGITYCVDADIDADQRYNIVNVGLRLASLPELATLERHFFTTSACGVCGKASLDAIGHARLPGYAGRAADQSVAPDCAASEAARGTRAVRGDGRPSRGRSVRRQRHAPVPARRRGPP